MNGIKKLQYIIFIFSVFLFPAVSVGAQTPFRVMFYNVENLFDTKDNPRTKDDDFLPDGNQRWSNSRYWKKLHDISKVIIMVGEGRPPALVGMCEIENDSVLYDLTKKASLNRHKYNYVVSNSRDARGMNVALLYQRDELKFISKGEYAPSFNSRAILHVTGRVVNGDTLDVFICHFHSRVEGIKKTQSYRIESASLLKQKTDSVSKKRKTPRIIIMGDFNDYPNDISLRETLNAQSLKAPISARNLYNMFYHRIKEKDFGSYKHRGKWGCLDQFIVNGGLLTDQGQIKVKNKEAHVYSADFLLQDDKKGGLKPFRTYSGYKYLGGTSDHLPIYMDLLIR